MYINNRLLLPVLRGNNFGIEICETRMIPLLTLELCILTGLCLPRLVLGRFNRLIRANNGPMFAKVL